MLEREVVDVIHSSPKMMTKQFIAKFKGCLTDDEQKAQVGQSHIYYTTYQTLGALGAL